MSLKTWMPSVEARRKISNITEGHLLPDHIKRWLAKEVRDLILNNRPDEVLKLIEQFTFADIIGKLDESLETENLLFYCLGDIWFFRFIANCFGKNFLLQIALNTLKKGARTGK